MAIKLYGDLMSQPTRAVLIFARKNAIDVEFVQTLIHKGQHRSPEFRKIYPLRKLPVLQHGELVIPEAAAMLSYLATTHSVPDHWYPDDPSSRARIDAAMHWHHGNLRRGAAPLVMHRVLAQGPGKGMGVTPDPKLAQDSQDLLTVSLRALERYWLKDQQFVGGDNISIADLLMTTELDMVQLLNGASEGPSYEELLAPFSKVREWMLRTKEECSPHYEDASALLQKSVEKWSKPRNASKL